MKTSVEGHPSLHMMKLDVQKDEEIYSAANRVENELLWKNSAKESGINLLICNAGILEYEVGDALLGHKAPTRPQQGSTRLN